MRWLSTPAHLLHRGPNSNGKQIFKREDLQSKSKRRASLAVIAPASKFSAGEYILTLKGVTQSGDVEDVSKSLFRKSLFRVEKK